MKRNQSILQFQRRLIRSAMMSPRNDAMNLLGIVYSNLDEFINVRLARDEEPEECLDELIETYETWAKAVYSKFPKLCSIASYSEGDLGEDYDEIKERFLAGETGFILNGRYFHCYCEFDMRGFPIQSHSVSIMALADKVIPTPKSPMTNNQVIQDYTKALVSKKVPEGSFRVTMSTDRDGQAGLVYVTRDKTDNDEYPGYTIHFKYPIMVEFDHVASTIVKYYQMNDNELSFMEAPHSTEYEELADRPMAIETRKLEDTSLYRLPAFIKAFDESSVTRLATAADVLSCTNAPFTNDHFGDNHTLFIDQLKECWMTIYRTDPVGEDEFNVRFIQECAKALGAKAHIYIESRARGSEKNNLILFQTLQALQADVYVIPHHESAFDKKVHAKVWLFKTADQNMVLTSTGNFSMAAQSCFRDTLYLQRGVSKEEFKKYVAMFKTIFNGEKYDNDIDSNFIWQPKLIRKRLENEIDGRISLAKLNIFKEDVGQKTSKQFIWIKANHVIDPDMNQKILEAANTDYLEVHVIARTACSLPLCVPYDDYEVRSISGKYLEHDRFYIFGHYDENDEPTFDKVFISSCDIMKRNLKERVEFIQAIDKDNAAKIGKLFQRMFEKVSDPVLGFFNYELTDYTDNEDNIDSTDYDLTGLGS